MRSKPKFDARAFRQRSPIAVRRERRVLRTLDEELLPSAFS